MAVPELDEIAQKLKSKTPVLPVTVRTFLSWFGAQRRGAYVVERIRAQLDDAGIVTYPDFEETWVDDPIGFLLLGTAEADNAQIIEDESAMPIEDGIADANAPSSENILKTRADPLYRVSKLKASNRPVTSVSPDQTLSFIVATMMVTGYSQLPVMSDERNVRGFVSWKSIGKRMALDVQVKFARDCMEPYEPFFEVRSDSSLFEAIPVIMRNDFVLVRGKENKITGIITPTDLAEQFRDLTQHFLVLNEIENILRDLIRSSFSIETIAGVCEANGSRPGRSLQAVEEMGFGEYILLLDHPERWATVGLKIDRNFFCTQLHRVRALRNNTMHFGPEGPSDDELSFLHDFTKFLAEIRNIQSSGRRTS